MSECRSNGILPTCGLHHSTVSSLHHSNAFSFLCQWSAADERLRQSADRALSVDTGDGCRSLGQEFITTEESIGVMNPRSARRDRLNNEPQRITKLAWQKVLAGSVRHDQQSPFALEIGVVKPGSSQQFDPS